MSDRFEKPDGQGCAEMFAWLVIAIGGAMFGAGVLFTILLDLIFD